jgi:hypothetical protein
VPPLLRTPDSPFVLMLRVHDGIGGFSRIPFFSLWGINCSTAWGETGIRILSGEEGADEFATDSLFNDGTDTIEGGPGNDTVRAAEGQSDVIDCGPGRDNVEFDAGLDSVKRCEIKEPL